MRFYQDTGIVVGHTKLGEADLIVSILTRDHGLVRAVAKGVRRTKSRFGSRLDLFMMVDFQAHIGRNLDIVTQVELVEPFGHGIVGDYDVFAAAAAMAETAAKLTENEPNTRDQYLLLSAALRSLCNREHPPRLALNAYLLRAMRTAGWEPGLDACVSCGAPGPHRAFSFSSGGVVCVACRTAADANAGEDATVLLHNLLNANWADAHLAHTHAVNRASRIVYDYVQWHLERRVKSLNLVEVQ